MKDALPLKNFYITLTYPTRVSFAMKDVLTLTRDKTLTYQGQHCHEGVTGFDEKYKVDLPRPALP